MKLITAISLSLVVAGTVYGQNAVTASTPKGNPDKSTVSGTIKDMRRQPVSGVEAFVYKPDSSIVASGVTDATGHFETNGVVPGDYFVKVVYPDTKFVTYVTGISFKHPGTAEINLKGDAPASDTAITYESLNPKPAAKAPKKK